MAVLDYRKVELKLGFGIFHKNGKKCFQGEIFFLDGIKNNFGKNGIGENSSSSATTVLDGLWFILAGS